MDNEVDYSQEICDECGEVLTMPADPRERPRERPRHVCGEEARTVAFALWIRYRVRIDEEDSRRRYRTDITPDGATKAREIFLETETALEEAGIPPTTRIQAQVLANQTLIEDARVLMNAFSNPQRMLRGWPKSADLMKRYFPEATK